MQRLVAVKTALGDQQAGADFYRLFMDEARIASLVQHPNVCAIHTLDEEQGVVFLVMDWSDGATLRELLDAIPDHRLDFAVAAHIAAGVAAGLHAAHELEDADGQRLNVVHRDVSPQNVLISARGHVKIADFGVAKARGQLHAATETGEVKGKLSYMAPEQVTTKHIDHRVDVFALGCVLYEATVGRRPFHGDDALATLYALLETPLGLPSEHVPGYPPELEAIVIGALEKEAGQRYQTAAELGHALEAWIASTGRVITEHDVESALHQALGPTIKRKNALIQDTAQRLDERKAVQVLGAPVADVSSNEPSIRTLGRERTEKTQGPWYRSWTAIAGAAIVVVGVGLGLGLRTGTSQAVAPLPQAEPADAPSPATTAAAPGPIEEVQTVKVTLRAEPSTATLVVDDGPALPNPYVAEQAPSDQVHTIRARAPGYRERVESTAFDSTKEVLLVLSKETVGSRPVAAAEKPEVSVPRSSDPMRLRKPIEKKPRVLDSENPFKVP
jgi:serine/threonine-protein kinase